MSMIGILSTFLFTTLNPKLQIEKAHDAKRTHDLAQIRTALDAYYSDYDCYPRNLDMLTTQKAYLKELPGDPTTGAPYQYEINENEACPQWYVLFAKMATSPDLNSSCSLSNMSSQQQSCLPLGASDLLSYTCVVGGQIDCSYISSKPLPSPVVPTPTPTPLATPSLSSTPSGISLPTQSPSPTPSLLPSPIPTPTQTISPTPSSMLTPTPTPTLPPAPTPTPGPTYCSSGKYYSCAGVNRCNSLGKGVPEVYCDYFGGPYECYCTSNCDGACK